MPGTPEERELLRGATTDFEYKTEDMPGVCDRRSCLNIAQLLTPESTFVFHDIGLARRGEPGEPDEGHSLWGFGGGAGLCAGRRHRFIL